MKILDFFIHGNSFKKRLIAHIFLWNCYFIFNIFYQKGFRPSDSILIISRDNLFFITIDIVFTYAFLFLIEKLFNRKLYLWFLFSSLILLCIDVLIYREVYYLIIKNLYTPEAYTYAKKTISLSNFIHSALLPLCWMTSLHLARSWFLNQQRISDIREQNLHHELFFLKTQLNQHFLFNVLNNIDSLILYNPGLASSSIINLSDLLRYTLYETSEEKVELKKELVYLRKYIDLFLIRCPSKNFIKTFINIEGDGSDIKIAPMLLIPFLENAIKHCDKNIKECISLFINANKEEVIFKIVNLKTQHEIESNDFQTDSGIGNLNIKRRLELIYPNRYSLIINNLENLYEVNLILKLKNYYQSESIKMYNN